MTDPFPKLISSGFIGADHFMVTQGFHVTRAANSAGTHVAPQPPVPWDLVEVIENPDEPRTFQELNEELDVRLDALRRGRTDWGCAGSHRGRYTPNQIDRGAPNCPRQLHHHHDAFCREPSDLELRLAEVNKPLGGWGSRA